MKESEAPNNHSSRIIDSIDFEHIPLDSVRLDTIFENLPPEEQQRYFSARDSIFQARTSAPLNEGNHWIAD